MSTRNHDIQHAPQAPPLTRAAPVLVFILAALVYGAFRSNVHYFDSIHYARITETGANLFWQKHILQHALVRALWHLQAEVAIGANSLRVAQLVNALAGGGAVAAVYLCLRRHVGAGLAAAFAALFGLTSVVSRHAIEGEVHMLPLLFLSLTLLLLERSRTRQTSGVWIGLGAAAAIWMHQSYVVFLPAVLAYLVASRAGRRTQLLTLVCAVVPCALVYLVVFARSGLAWGELPRWLLHESGFRGQHLSDIARGVGALLTALSPWGKSTPPSPWAALLPALLFAPLAWLAVRRRSEPTVPLLTFCATSVGIGLPAIIWHQPDFQYFCPIVLAIVLVGALGAPAVAPSWRTPLVGGFVVLYAVLGVRFVLIPAHDVLRNEALARARFLSEHATVRDVVASVGTGHSTGDLHYFPYFSRVRAVTLWEAYSRFGSVHLLPGLRTLIDEAHEPGGRVLAFAELVTPGATFEEIFDVHLPVHGDDVLSFLEADYDVIPIAAYCGAGYQEMLVELRRRISAPAPAGRPCGLGCPFGYTCEAGRCRCGPRPHFDARGARCLPSCGLLLNRLLDRPAGSACCSGPCASRATFTSGPRETWDCEYCCGGPRGVALCALPSE